MSVRGVASWIQPRGFMIVVVGWVCDFCDVGMELK